MKNIQAMHVDGYVAVGIWTSVMPDITFISMPHLQKATMGDESVETLCNKIEFLSILVTFPPFPPRQC